MPADAASVNWTYPAGGSVVTQTAFSITIAYPSAAVTGTVTAQAVNGCGSQRYPVLPASSCRRPPEEKRWKHTPVY